MTKVSNKSSPVRMCIVCRVRLSRASLMRLKIVNGELREFDGFGRSFYLCSHCLNNNRLYVKLKKLKSLTQTKEQIYLSMEELVSKWQKK